MAMLQDKVAIITGASSGIGHASARLFAAEGAKVVVGARREQRLQRLVSEISDSGGEAIALAGDVRSEQYARDLVDAAVNKFGGLDVAFNNAGIMGTQGLDSHTIPAEEWANTLETNLTGAFWGAKYQIPALLEHGGGSVIFTSSFVGHNIGFPQNSAYAASKAGLVGLTRALAAEYGSKAIRINALLPGGTDTEMAQEFASNPEIVEFVKNMHALKRLAAPYEIAHSALYLASDASCFTTGTALLADGGLTVCKT